MTDRGTTLLTTTAVAVAETLTIATTPEIGVGMIAAEETTGVQTMTGHLLATTLLTTTAVAVAETLTIVTTPEIGVGMIAAGTTDEGGVTTAELRLHWKVSATGADLETATAEEEEPAAVQRETTVGTVHMLLVTSLAPRNLIEWRD